jgi:hypothetical protein
MGTKKVLVTGNRSFYTYAHLREMAWNAYEAAETLERGRYLHCQSAVVFCAFTLEGYLNHIGVLRVKTWDILERKLSWREKLEFIGRELSTTFDRGKQPFQAIVEAFAFRDQLAHGKSVLNEAFSGEFVLGVHDSNSYLDPEWLKKFESLEKVKAILDDMESALRQLQVAAGLESEPLGLMAEGHAEGPGS